MLSIWGYLMTMRLLYRVASPHPTPAYTFLYLAPAVFVKSCCEDFLQWFMNGCLTVAEKPGIEAHSSKLQNINRERWVLYKLCHLSLAISGLYLAIPALLLDIPALSLAIPSLSLSIPAHSLAVPGIPCCPGVILGFTPVGREDSVATLCSLSLIMVEEGAELHVRGIKQILVLINMASMTLQMWHMPTKMTIL